jgi:hypothetical protein
MLIPVGGKEQGQGFAPQLKFPAQGAPYEPSHGPPGRFKGREKNLFPSWQPRFFSQNFQLRGGSGAVPPLEDYKIGQYIHNDRYTTVLSPEKGRIRQFPVSTKGRKKPRGLPRAFAVFFFPAYKSRTAQTRPDSSLVIAVIAVIAVFRV